MKLIILAVFIFLIIMSANAQNTFPPTGSAGIGTTAPVLSSILEMKSTTQGMLVPRMTQAQRNAIVSPATGLLIYQTNASAGFYYYNGSSWTAVSPIGVSKTLNNLTAPTAINQSLLPGVTSTLDLGSSTNLWNNFYLNGDIYHADKRIFGVAGTNNVFAGFFSGPNTTGSNNSFFGNNAGRKNTTGSNNIFLGNAAGYNNTAQNELVFIGDSAGYSSSASGLPGSGNTFIGSKSGFSTVSGFSNTAIGEHSFQNNTSGVNNTSLGVFALQSNTITNSNVAVGSYALSSFNSTNLPDGFNTAMGDHAMQFAASGSKNVAIGFGALSSDFSTTGTGSGNISIGVNTLRFNTTGNNNTTVGSYALYSSSAGSELVAVGDSAFYTLSGGSGGNTAVGARAGKNTTTGNFSTYIGWKSGYSGTTANANTALGASSLFSNKTGFDNIAIGVDALNANTTGSFNTIIGKGAGTTNKTGSGNVSLGVRSLYLNTSGNKNTAIGDSAGYTNSTGSNNTFIGAYADASSNNLLYATAIGYKAKVSTSNTIVLGDATADINVAIGATTADVYKLKVVQGSYGFDLFNSLSGDHWEHFVSTGNGSTNGGAEFTQGDMLLYYDNGISPLGAFDHTSGAYKTTSDERLKTNIKPMPSILDRINLLEPVTYNFKSSTNQNTSIGFIAQKVEKIFPSLVSHYADTARGTDVNLMDYTGFGVIAIKGIQELQKQMHDKDTTISNQQQQIDELKNMLLALQQKVESCSPCGSSSVQSANQSSVMLANTPMLAQNIPNPFTNTTVINYTLPQKFSSAQIIITDNNGKTIKQTNISGAGKGSLTVDASVLATGAYQYSLLIGGKLFQTKQMIKAK